MVALTFLAAFTGSKSVQAAPPLHESIDRLIAAGTPDYATLAAPLASDAEFLRRVTLDLTGTIPTAAEAREFLASSDPEKRTQLVDRLLASPEWPRRMQQVCDVLLMERLPQKHVPVADWQKYLHDSFAANKPWDQLVREILSADGSDPATRGAARFYLDRDGEVHQLTRDIGRLFLGVDLECAQCHNHPQVDDYKQSHYYGLAAYLIRGTLFNTPDKKLTIYAEKADGEVTYESVFDLRDKISKGPQTTLPVLFDGQVAAEPKFKKGEEYTVKPDKKVRGIPNYSRRSLLGDAITGPDNVRFRRASANRWWALLMGRGLIDPLDRDHGDNPPSHPELLEILASDLFQRKYDLRGYLREIVLSQTYQRGSFRPADAPPVEPESFAQATIRPLAPEQFAWALLQGTGMLDAERLAQKDKPDLAAIVKKYRGVENRFISLFGNEPGRPEPGFDARTDQALFLANDPLLLSWLQPRTGNLADRLTKIPADNPQAVADELYLATLTRFPNSDEGAEIREYLATRTADRLPALQELIWALVTSAEFRFNH